VPSVQDIQDETLALFGKQPCLWQAKAAQAFLQGNDIICIAGTSMGKRLTFWMPLLFCLKAIQIIITPLNQLGKQQVEGLESMGLQAITINTDTAKEKIY
ncbi:hypothetical protein BKA82DRAFT_49712, partial [Pisolithus tinctorius]